MEKFIEKFTFYDILGYGLPGFLFMIVAYWITYPDKAAVATAGFIDNDVIMVLSVIAFSHVLGSLFSEFGHFFKRMLSGSKCFLAWTQENSVDLRQQSVLVDAERRSNLFAENEISEVGKSLSDIEVQKMYGDLQTDEHYNRIHNYSSVEVMCKNVAVAFFFDTLIAVIYGLKTCSFLKIVMCIPFLIISSMMIHRAARFERKKKEYTVIWFLEKYKK